jgi:hypothetical protein
MAESREIGSVVEGRLDERLVERALEAASGGSEGERVRSGVETMVEIAEADPAAALEALWRLRYDRAALERLEACLGVSPERATLAVGAAIQLARAELASPAPNLRSRIPELMRWLEGDW